MKSSILRIFIKTSVILLIIVLGAAPWVGPAHSQSIGVNGTKKVFLPVVINYKAPPPSVLLGVYTENYLGLQSTIDNEVKAIDSWSGKHLSIVGTFIAFEDANPDYNITVPLGLIWESGYTPFVNLGTTKTLATINSGRIDPQIRAMADAFKHWRDLGLRKNQNRKAFLAPFQEMNGAWVSYHGSPADFKAAFSRVQNLFTQQGAGAAVRWVFAPNGWSAPNEPPFEDYYPGDASVEAVALSAYNAGYCPSASWKVWQGPDVVFGPYLQRMQTMAPSKPIFIAQTGTTAYDQYGQSTQSKNNWLIDSFKYLANSPGIKGVIYFNMLRNQTCDWAFYSPNGQKYDGYKQAVQQYQFTYISPEGLAVENLSR